MSHTIMSIMVRWLFAWLVLSCASPCWSTTDVKIGVLAFRGTAMTLQRWQATADYLKERVPGLNFTIVPVTNDNIVSMVQNAEIDFLLSNPASYAFLEAKYGVTRVLTLVNQSSIGGITQYGSVIFTTAGRNDIRTLRDLHGKSLLAVHKDAFGGWWMAWRELNKIGIDPQRDLTLSFSGFPQDNIVKAVLSKKVDAGVVRSQILERMADEGKLKLSQIRVINHKRLFGFPYALSTPLYPEWPLATLKHVPGDLAEMVVLALLDLDSSHPAARQANITGWTVPLDYLPVHELMKELHLGHYADWDHFTLRQVAKKYWYSFAFIAVTLLGLCAVIFYTVKLNSRLRYSHALLQKEMLQRQKAQIESSKLGRILDSSPSEIYVFNLVTEELIHANISAKHHLAKASDLLLSNLLPDIPDHVKEKMRTTIEQHNETAILHCECSLFRQNGDSVTAAVQFQIYHDDQAPTLVCIAQDISEFKKAEITLDKERERNEITLQSITEGIITADQHGNIEYINKIAASLTGWSLEDAVGKAVDDIIRLVDSDSGKPSAPDFAADMHPNLFGREKSRLLVTKTGDRIAVDLSTIPRHDQHGKPCGFTHLMRDRSELHELTERMQYFVTHDELTGLINRRVFENEIREALRSANLNHTQHAVLYLNLDKFRVINDSFGHQAGDELIKQLTIQLKVMVRGCDTLARLGGDQFGVLLRGCTLDDAQLAASRMQEVINLYPFAWNANIVHMGVSIGIVPVRPGIGKLRDVLNAADTAGYVAKDLGSNRIYIYNPNDEWVRKHQGDMRNSRTIKQSLEENRFRLYYQEISPLANPKQSNRVEILLRMHHVKGEIVQPPHFIPSAERYQLMPDIDRWVVENTFKFIRDNPVEAYRFNINLSAQSLSQDGFLHFVSDAFKRYDVKGSRVCIEISETTAIANFREAQRFIKILRELDVEFALDDFGDGLSSCHYLKRLNVDFLKIDGAFVRNMIRDNKDYAIVESMNNIAHMMGMQTIAEYVESVNIKKELARISVDYVQGYEISKPRPLHNLLTSPDLKLFK